MAVRRPARRRLVHSLDVHPERRDRPAQVRRTIRRSPACSATSYRVRTSANQAIGLLKNQADPGVGHGRDVLRARLRARCSWRRTSATASRCATRRATEVVSATRSRRGRVHVAMLRLTRAICSADGTRFPERAHEPCRAVVRARTALGDGVNNVDEAGRRSPALQRPVRVSAHLFSHGHFNRIWSQGRARVAIRSATAWKATRTTSSSRTPFRSSRRRSPRLPVAYTITTNGKDSDQVAGWLSPSREPRRSGVGPDIHGRRSRTASTLA